MGLGGYSYPHRTSGFMCTDCPKLFPLNPAPAPSVSPVPGRKKRSKVAPVTTEQILRERAESRRRTRGAAQLAGTLKQDGVRIRGRWVSTGRSHAVIVLLSANLAQPPDAKEPKVSAQFMMGHMAWTARISRISLTLVSAHSRCSLISSPMLPPTRACSLMKTQ